MGHSAGAHETLEMLDGMLCSFDHPEQSSTEQGRARQSKGEQCCMVLGEMLDSFDQGSPRIASYEKRCIKWHKKAESKGTVGNGYLWAS